MNYSRWIDHFETNRKDRLEPDWGSPLRMEDGRRRALAKSLAEYQLGDGGGPCQLIAGDAEAFRGSSETVRRVVDMWFAEEAGHSRLLAGAVNRLGGEFVTDSFAFRWFNRCRRLLDVRFEMLVLLVVEIVSTGYYRVIRRHCGDEPVEAMCALILRDEAGHVRFHRDRLAADFPDGAPRAWVVLFHTLGHACAAFLWLGHGRWLRPLGASWPELHRHVRHGLRRFVRELRSRPIADLSPARLTAGPVTPRDRDHLFPQYHDRAHPHCTLDPGRFNVASGRRG